MYKTTMITVTVLWSVLLCAGCDTPSERSLRVDLERNIHKEPNTRVYSPQLDEPKKSDPHGYKEIVKATGPVEYLKKSEVFRLGPVGFAPETPPEEFALRMLMAEDDCPSQFKRLFDEGSIAGKLYALTGLYYKDRSTFNELASGLREDSRSVPRQTGCLVFTQTVKEIIKSIESGDFDRDMQRAARQSQ